MSGKSLILIGLGAGALYTYFCISTHKDQLYEKLYPSVVATDSKSESTEKEVAPLVQQVVEKDNPSFTFINTQPYKFNALLEKAAENGEMTQQINKWCQEKPCENNIQFLENIKKEAWSKETQSVVAYMIENQVENGSITIKENTIHITGALKGKEAQDELEKELSLFDPSFQIQNETTLIEQPKEEPNATITVTETVVIEEPIETVVVEAPKETVVVETVTVEEPKETVVVKTVTAEEPKVEKEEHSNKKDKLEEAQSKIDTLLENSVINFQFNSSKIVPSSQKVLDHIVEIVNGLNIEEVKLNIAGHTDASGSASYNKQLSQQRADSVKTYLLKKSIHAQKLTSTGYGEERLIFAPNDKQNRRVEITLTKGE
jgi:OOP family OmpA-OmpF porin